MWLYKELRNILRYKFKKYLVKKWVNDKRKLTNPSEQTREYEIIKRYTETNYFKTKLYLVGKKEKLIRYLKGDVTYKNF